MDSDNCRLPGEEILIGLCVSLICSKKRVIQNPVDEAGMLKVSSESHSLDSMSCLQKNKFNSTNIFMRLSRHDFFGFLGLLKIEGQRST